MSIITNNSRLRPVADRLFERGAFKVGGFKLKLHDKTPEAPLSPIYFNLRDKNNPKPGPLVAEDYELMVGCLLELIGCSGVRFEALAGIPNAGTPFVDAIGRLVDLENEGVRIIKLEKEVAADGRRIMPKSGFKYIQGERIILIDDLVTGADTKLEAIKAIEDQGAIVVGIFVLIDREQGGRKIIEDAGYKLFAVFPLQELLLYYLEEEKITQEKYEEIIAYISAN